MAKVANNKNDLVKGSSTRQKLKNSKGYTLSHRSFLLHWADYFQKKSVATNLR